MRRVIRHFRALGLLCTLSACTMLGSCAPDPIDDTAFNRLYSTALPPEDGTLRVYHLGHSLVGQDMPAMLRQMAGAGHSFNSQLGWGTNLKEHWEPDLPVNGFEDSNSPAVYREPFEALAAGEYDAVVLTEAVEIRASIKWMEPDYYLHKWAAAAWDGNPEARVYFYEVWHGLDTEEGWLTRLDRDFPLYWEGEILRRALAYSDTPKPIYVIPGGQVMAAVVRAIEAKGGVGPVADRQGLFTDTVHFNDYGAYLIALTHYAVLYRRSPVGLPHALIRADGTPADDPGPELARLMQETVWQVVSSYAPTGIAPDG